MSLCARSRCLPSLLRRRKVVLGWGSAFAVGLAAVHSRSIGCGDTRTGTTLLSPFRSCSLNLFRDLSSRSFLSTLTSKSSLFSAILSSQPPMGLTPPQPPPVWNHSAEDITRLTKEHIEKNRVVQNQVGALAPEACNFDTVSGDRLIHLVVILKFW